MVIVITEKHTNFYLLVNETGNMWKEIGKRKRESASDGSFRTKR